MTNEQLEQLRIRKPDLFAARPDGDNQGAATQPKRAARHVTLGADKAQKKHPEKFLVRITSYRRRLLDEDNLIAKYHIDAARYCGPDRGSKLLPSDSPAQAHIEVRQVQVKTKEECRTVMEFFEIVNHQPKET